MTPMTNARSRSRVLQLAAALSLAPTLTASAAQIDWANTSGGNFSTAANWSPAVVPGSADIARFNINNTYNVTFTNNTTVNTLSFNGGNVTFFLNGWTLTSTNT